jgi:hypothetical protein
MKRIKQHIIAGAAALACILSSNAAASARTSIKATLDSAQITMGYQTAIHLDIVDAAGAPSQLIVDKNSFPAEVEIIDWADGDTTNIGNNLVEIKRALIIQSFDSGAYHIPPFLLDNGPDTIKSNTLTLKVNPVDVSQMSDINPIAQPSDFISKWYDFLPDWLTEYWLWMLLGLLIVVGCICAVLLVKNKDKVLVHLQQKRLPPDQIAFNRLSALREAQLWERGQEKEYYTRLIDILRDYLQERFGINAMEMTSSQILKTLQANEETKLSHQLMQHIVEIADYVKFAKVRPLPDDNVRSLQNAIQFVEETRPAPEPDENATTTNNNQPKETK